MVADHKAVGPFISLAVPEHRSPTSLFLSIAQDASDPLSLFFFAQVSLWSCRGSLVMLSGYGGMCR